MKRNRPHLQLLRSSPGITRSVADTVMADSPSGAEGGETLLVDMLHVADGFWSRFLGLQFRCELPAGHGLLLVPCSSIHTCWMRFSLDIVLLDTTGRVLEVRRNVPPWRAVVPRSRTHAVLELPAGEAERIEEGAQLRVRRSDDSIGLPRSVKFLPNAQSDLTATPVKETAR